MATKEAFSSKPRQELGRSFLNGKLKNIYEKTKKVPRQVKCNLREYFRERPYWFFLNLSLIPSLLVVMLGPISVVGDNALFVSVGILCARLVFYCVYTVACLWIDRLEVLRLNRRMRWFKQCLKATPVLLVTGLALFPSLILKMSTLLTRHKVILCCIISTIQLEMCIIFWHQGVQVFDFVDLLFGSLFSVIVVFYHSSALLIEGITWGMMMIKYAIMVSMHERED